MYDYKKNTSKYQINLAENLKYFFQTNPNLTNINKIIRLETKINNNIKPLHWLLQQKNSTKTYWSDRENRFEMAGVGEADIVFSQNSIEYSKLFANLRNRLSSSYKHLRYYGGISFKQKKKIDRSWQHFGNYRFVVPKFEIYTENNETYLACNFLLKNSKNYHLQLNQLLLELNQLVFNSPSHPISLPSLITREDFPNERGWHKNIEAALASFAQGKTTKIVLARKSIFEFSKQIEPISLLLLLKETNPHLFHFCFQPSNGNAFIGGSPERLYSRTQRLLQTEALAGTRPRGNTLEEEQTFSQELLTSDKDIREHQLVVQSLQSVLNQMCHSIGKNRKPAILKFHKVQHLYTPCNGILFDQFSDEDILLKLNPTPAVGGYPREQALMAIDELEPFERGWYAGPVGWIGYDAAEFAVAIRSGLVQNNHLSLFAGAGIVQGSQAENEWQEIENKLASFLQIINC